MLSATPPPLSLTHTRTHTCPLQPSRGEGTVDYHAIPSGGGMTALACNGLLSHFHGLVSVNVGGGGRGAPMSAGARARARSLYVCWCAAHGLVQMIRL